MSMPDRNTPPRPLVEGNEESSSAGGGRFPATRWSMVLAVRAQHSGEAAAALEQLCQLYWLPVYVFIRSRGRGVEEAEDLTQSFFATLIARQGFDGVSPERGAFRAFVLAALKRFLVDDWRKRSSQKRGGGQVPIAIDRDLGEQRYLQIPATEDDPDTLFERQWAAALLDRMLRQLGESYARNGKSRQFELLSPYLAGTNGDRPYAAIAGEMGISEGGARAAMARVRNRFARMLREEIAQTVESESEVDEEIQHLFRLFARR